MYNKKFFKVNLRTLSIS